MCSKKPIAQKITAQNITENITNKKLKIRIKQLAHNVL